MRSVSLPNLDLNWTLLLLFCALFSSSSFTATSPLPRCSSALLLYTILFSALFLSRVFPLFYRDLFAIIPLFGQLFFVSSTLSFLLWLIFYGHNFSADKASQERRRRFFSVCSSFSTNLPPHRPPQSSRLDWRTGVTHLFSFNFLTSPSSYCTHCSTGVPFSSLSAQWRTL